MSKIAINNEIVLMRQAVRQSRVSVVRKLIKEAKLLQARKHGDEKIREKCKRKAQRLLAEITALKKIKDDEISKFGIAETKSLSEILNDSKAESRMRVMARITFHKILQERITKFREKFPEYEKHLGPGRKKLSKLQRKANREARNGRKENETATGEVNEVSGESSEEEEEDDDVGDSEDADEPVDSKIDENTEEDKTNEQLAENESINDVPEPGSILRVKTTKSAPKRRKNDAQSVPESNEHSENPVKSEKSKKLKPKAKIPVKPKKSIPIRVISKEATVKRFTDLVENRESSEIVRQPDDSTDSRKSDVKIEKQIDSFFMTENGESEYMSVVVPKSKLYGEEEEEQDDRFGQNHAAMRRKNFHERNNKFFSKIDRRSGNVDKFNSNTEKRGANNYSSGRGSTEKFARSGNVPARNARNPRSAFEKKSDIKEEELHPSWAARKKQQEILKQGFQGKKIVFDD